MARFLTMSSQTMLDIGRYYVDNQSTIRKTASAFKRSKTCIHGILSYRLLEIDFELTSKIKELMSYNLENRSSRGGLALKGLRKGKKNNMSKKLKAESELMSAIMPQIWTAIHRQDRKVTQLAIDLNMHQSSLSKSLHGQRRFKPTELTGLCQLLNIDNESLARIECKKTKEETK